MIATNGLLTLTFQTCLRMSVEMEDAGIAVKLSIPFSQDENGSPCLESSAFGCKVTHDLTHPELCLVMDEVGGNIS